MLHDQNARTRIVRVPRRSTGVHEMMLSLPMLPTCQKVRRSVRTLCGMVVASTSIARGVTAQEREPNEAWRIIVPPQSCLVFARDGSLIGEIGKQKRTLVSLRSLPRYVGQAFVAVEDQRPLLGRRQSGHVPDGHVPPVARHRNAGAPRLHRKHP